MSQPLQNSSPLTARLYDLEYPRSLGVYSTYQEVQSVVDTLADNSFPVQSTLIVGTDLKLMERVTGRRTWPRVLGQGVLSGLWMGLFLGLLLLLITPGNFMVVLTSILLGIIFFTVWSAVGYAMTGGKRDFTSMTATIPMQYELLVEHKHAEQARKILAEFGAAPASMPAAPHPAPQTAQQPGAPSVGTSPGGHDPRQGAAQQGTGQQFGVSPQQGSAQHGAGTQHGAGSQHGGPYGTSPYGAGTGGSPSAPARPSYGQPATPAAPPAATGDPARSGRPSFGRPAGEGDGEQPRTGQADQDRPADSDRDAGS
ncbi:general stress protein [Brachybacterium sp. AOP43-C2-M15]|uniref:general stress protein n=1 Tax=Brachybacterium sp. AOP43-C2-M15 TaxID=3457661 RepID=UPI00403459A2